MARFHYTVKTESGTAERKSDRIYTHAVLVRGHHAALVLSRRKHDVSSTRDGLKYAEDKAAGRKPRYSFDTDQTVAADVVRYRIALANAEQALEAERASPTDPLANPEGVLTWCGRPDLAAKAAASARKSWVGVRIVEVEVREIAKRAPKAEAK